MSVIVINSFAFAAPAAFSNARSLTFTSASSQSLSRSWGAVGTSAKKFSISLFYKRATTGATMYLCAGGENTSNNEFELRFDSNDKIRIRNSSGGSTNLDKVTTATYTDTASWHHLLLAVDMDQATAANRVRLYIDGTEVSAWDTNTVPAAGTALAWNAYNTTYYIGRLNFSAGSYYNGLLDEFIYSDGQQYAVSDFASGNLPIAFAGSYGTRGFRLRFEDNTSTTTLGADDSSNGNNWTLNSMTTGNSSTSVP